MAGESTPAKRLRMDDTDADDRPVKRPSYDYSNTIQVLVGPEETVFVAHKDPICAKSKFFRAACSERWKEGQEKIVRLPDVEPETFQRYLDWTYGDVLVAESDVILAIKMAVKLHLLGDALGDARLCNKTSMALLGHITIDLLHPRPSEMKMIWENTPQNSVLRRLMVDATAMRLKPDRFEKDVNEYPVDLVQQVAVKLRHQTTNMKPEVFQANCAEYLEAEDEA